MSIAGNRPIERTWVGLDHYPTIVLRGHYDNGKQWGRITYTLEGAYLQKGNDSNFTITVNAPDYETRIAEFRGVGFHFDFMGGSYIACKGVVLEASFFEEDEPVTDVLPSVVDFPMLRCDIEVSWGRFTKEAEDRYVEAHDD